MTIQQRITKIVSTMIIAGLCVTPEMMAAQQPSSQPQSQQTPQATPPQNNTQAAPAPATQTAPATSQQPAKSGAGTSVDPSQAPLTPVTTYPDASSQGQQEPEPQNGQAPAVTTTEEAPDAPQAKKPSEPVGAAAAEKVPTAGGAASKPAGIAIAPAKQHQTRSLLIKIGAIAAAGIAVGTIYGLSRSSPSIPPHSTIAGATQK